MIDSLVYHTQTGSTTSTNEIKLAYPVVLRGVYAKNTSNNCFAELYLRKGPDTNSRNRHYLAQGYIVNSDYDVVQWNGQLKVGSPYYLNWIFKDCEVNDHLWMGWSWEVKR